jgi:hypothetical protein
MPRSTVTAAGASGTLKTTVVLGLGDAGRVALASGLLDGLGSPLSLSESASPLSAPSAFASLPLSGAGGADISVLQPRDERDGTSMSDRNRRLENADNRLTRIAVKQRITLLFF